MQTEGVQSGPYANSNIYPLNTVVELECNENSTMRGEPSKKKYPSVGYKMFKGIWHDAEQDAAASSGANATGPVYKLMSENKIDSETGMSSFQCGEFLFVFLVVL